VKDMVHGCVVVAGYGLRMLQLCLEEGYVGR
jgi:hypothetical protein